MRKVTVSEYLKNDEGFMLLVETGKGLFYEWGVNYEEFESGPGNYSIAIVEYEDGTIESVPVEQIKFIDLWDSKKRR